MIKHLLADYCRRTYFGNNLQPVSIGVYRPSVLSWSCIRRQWNYYKSFAGKKPDEIPDETVLLLSGGVVFHRLIQSLKEDGRPYWSATEVECSIEVEVAGGEKIKIVGHADAIRGRGLERTVYEFKHTRTMPSSPYFQHILQLNFYMGALGISRGVILYSYYTQDGGIGIKEFPRIYSDWHMEHLITRAQTLHTLLINNTPPRCSCRDRLCETETSFR
jgi:CRISPR/Cas system-associated exonuclease Cas4 (RecB family)